MYIASQTQHAATNFTGTVGKNTQQLADLNDLLQRFLTLTERYRDIKNQLETSRNSANALQRDNSDLRNKNNMLQCEVSIYQAKMVYLLRQNKTLRTHGPATILQPNEDISVKNNISAPAEKTSKNTTSP